MSNIHKSNSSKFWHNTRKNASIILTTASVAFFFIIRFIIGDETLLGLNGSQVALAVSIGTTFLGIMITQQSNHSEVRRLIGSVKTGFRIDKIDTSDEVNSEILSKIKNAKNIKNTYFPNRNRRISGVIANEDAADIYNKWLSGEEGNEWKDIVTPEEIFDPRFSKIGANCKIKGSKHHYIHVLKNKNTCPNFIIIEYPNNKSEVYWGWISEKHDRQGTIAPYVFRTEELEIVEFFIELFDILWSRKTWGKPIALEHKAHSASGIISRNFLIDKVGYWANFSVLDGTLNTLGVYHIHIRTDSEGRRNFHVTGATFDLELKVFELPDHSHQDIAHYENRMFIEVQDKARRQRVECCFYEFEDNSEPKLYGFYSKDFDDKKHHIVGKKILDKGFELPPFKTGDQMPNSVRNVFAGMLKDKDVMTELDRVGVTIEDMHSTENKLNRLTD